MDQKYKIEELGSKLVWFVHLLVYIGFDAFSSINPVLPSF